MNNRTMEYGWCQNKDIWEEQLVDPPNEYYICVLFSIFSLMYAVAYVEK